MTRTGRPHSSSLLAAALPSQKEGGYVFSPLPAASACPAALPVPGFFARTGTGGVPGASGESARRKEGRPAAGEEGTDAGRQEPGLQASVVVPTCGRAELLNRCLEALLAQELSAGQYEVLVVDDAPAAATAGIVRGWAEKGAAQGLSIHYIANPGPHGPAAARNRGWRAAQAPIVAFTDDDTVPAPGWLVHGLAAFQQGEGADVVCGRVQMPLSGMPTDYEADAQQLESAEFVTANCLCRRTLLAALGGFDEDFRMAWREDSDLHFRLLEQGARIVYAGDALVVHPVRPAPWGVSIAQQKKIQFDALLYKKHPRLYRQRIRATPRWDYYLIVLALLAAILGLLSGRFWLLSAGAGAWLGMTAVFCVQRLRGKALTPSHVLEMAWTSALIPPLAVFWRLVGIFKFRVPFA